MTSAGYLRFPHVQGDLLTFIAEDDVWLAPVSGGRAWRLSADQAEATHPRFARDGASVAWISWRDGPAEVYLAGTDGAAPGRRLTYWGEPAATVSGWTPDGEIIALTASSQPFERQFWAHAVPPDGGPARPAAVRPGRRGGHRGHRPGAAERLLGAGPGVLEAVPGRHRGRSGRPPRAARSSASWLA